MKFRFSTPNQNKVNMYDLMDNTDFRAFQRIVEEDKYEIENVEKDRVMGQAPNDELGIPEVPDQIYRIVYYKDREERKRRGVTEICTRTGNRNAKSAKD
jgi:hypothetical protein